MVWPPFYLDQKLHAKIEDFFTRRGFKNASDFLRQFSHLSGVVLHQPGGNEFWINPLAKHKVPPEIMTAIQRLDTH